jgi:sorbitol-specific phosphotransferase system component IIA
MGHPCTQFNDGQPFSYADESFYHKSTRIDEQFDQGQQFKLKT